MSCWCGRTIPTGGNVQTVKTIWEEKDGLDISESQLLQPTWGAGPVLVVGVAGLGDARSAHFHLVLQQKTVQHEKNMTQQDRLRKYC